jgi:hypothetical protein
MALSKLSYKDYGDPLEKKVQDYNMTIDYDGYGLVQSTVTYHIDKAMLQSMSSYMRVGDAHPDLSLTFLSLHKWDVSVDKGNVMKITGHYAGIADGKSQTTPQITYNGASVTEPIETHVNFTRLTPDNKKKFSEGRADAQTPIGGIPPTGNSKSYNKAIWTLDENSGEYVFNGFGASKDENAPNPKAGVRSYYKGSIAMRGVIYFSSQQDASMLSGHQGYVSKRRWGDFDLLPAPFCNQFNQWNRKAGLLNTVGLERFGNLWKVSYEVLASGENGWDPDIYPHDGQWSSAK